MKKPSRCSCTYRLRGFLFDLIFNLASENDKFSFVPLKRTLTYQCDDNAENDDGAGPEVRQQDQGGHSHTTDGQQKIAVQLVRDHLCEKYRFIINITV